ncbi:MAG: response regulator [Desulfobacteraceae bacterium]|nr:MAG: response regulator [Desulfobacteraceae bacterium]
MPGMTGSELSQEILKIRPDIPIIICSGYSERLDKLKAKGLKVAAFLDKPLLIDDLITITKKGLDKSRMSWIQSLADWSFC